MNYILHITTKNQWKNAETIGVYSCDSLEKSGFIHCSKPEQVNQVVKAQFHGQKGLVLLFIDPDKVKPEVRYEDLYNDGAVFPHIYGQLNADAVVKTTDLEPDENGRFNLLYTF